MKEIHCDGGINTQSFFNPQNPRKQEVKWIEREKNWAT